MKCRSYKHSFSVKCLVMLTFQLEIVLVGFLEISCWIPSMTFTVMNWTEVSYCPRSYDTNSSIKQKMPECVWQWFLFLSRVAWDQMCSKTPQSVTKQMNIRYLHSAEGHCYLQYSQVYSAAFKITNWIDNVFTIIFLFTYNIDVWIAAKDNHNGSKWWAPWLTTMPRWQCESIG